MTPITRKEALELAKRTGMGEEAMSRQLQGAAPYIEPPPKQKKYKNKSTYSDIVGRNFHSAMEARFAEELWARQEAGEISELSYQVKVTLLGCVVMRPDFRYVEDGETIWHEFKGFATDSWRLQRKLWSQVGPGEYRVTYHKKPMDIIRPAPSSELIAYVLRHLLRDVEGG